MPHWSLQGLPVLGLFSADSMANYDVDIDVPNHHFALYNLCNCGKRIEPFERPYFEVPFHLDGTAIKLDLKLNDTTLSAQLDSGASITTMTEEDARRAGVTKASWRWIQPIRNRSGSIGIPSVRIGISSAAWKSGTSR
ncbi:MAG: aspartyl protease family protein [Janthinobacterium lividum]